MAKYRKKPIIVDACQWIGQSKAEAIKFCEDNGLPEEFKYDGKGGIIIPTLEGKMIASKGDFIIEGIKGEHYPCKPEIFAATYEPCCNFYQHYIYGDDGVKPFGVLTLSDGEKQCPKQ